jgi:amidase
MGEETISSGRSPASNNGLVAYTPSRGLISIRGNWPLFPTCDTVVPHTRTVEDMFALLNVIVAGDEKTTCDFWREQPFVQLPAVDSIRPKSYFDLSDAKALAGKKFGVPKMYIGKSNGASSAREVHTRQSVIDLWNRSSKILQGLGATVVEVDFPVVTNFEKPDIDTPESKGQESTAPPHRNEVDMCQLMAYAWDDFLAANGDTNIATSLAQVDSASIFPRPPNSIPDKYDSADPLVRHKDVIAHITGGRIPTYEIPGLADALKKLETARKQEFEAWLQDLRLDGVVFPCNGDVGKADADVNEDSAAEAWQNGVLFSNGNCVIRQYGIPTVSVPMGVMSDTGMPVNLTFASKAYDDSNLLSYAYAYEKASQLRQIPPRTPQLPTDSISLSGDRKSAGSTPPRLTIDEIAELDSPERRTFHMAGTANKDELDALHVYVDGMKHDDVKLVGSRWEVDIAILSRWEGRAEEKGVPNPEKAMVIVVASGKNGRSTAEMRFV